MWCMVLHRASLLTMVNPHDNEADPAEVEKFSAGLPDEFLACRTLGHSWRPHRAEFRKEERAYYTSLLCTRCETERAQWLDTFGRIVSNSYHYAEGYQHKGLGYISGDGRATMRLEQLARILPDGLTRPAKRKRK